MTRKTRGFQSLLGASVALSLLLFPSFIQAKNIGADPPPCSQPPSCKQCTAKAPTCAGSFAGGSISYSEGNLSVSSGPLVSSLKSAFGPTLSLSLTYNSYNADGSRAQLDTAMGYGWTHSYNIFLFNQVGNMFRMDGTGRVTKFQYQGGGLFSSATGYFETLVNNMDGTFTIKQKDGTSYLFAPVANTLFLVFGPVYRLQSITDRNNNKTTVSYDSSGHLTEVTDTYGRSLMFGYDGSQHLTSITDPLGRTTTFTYDSTDRKLTQIDDPDGKVIKYGYDTLYQMTQQIDRDGRVFTYSYGQLEPRGITDQSSHSVFSLANPSNWATNSTSLAEYQTRVYTPSTTNKTDGLGNVWKYTYDANGYVDTAVAPDGSTITYTYDPGTLLPASITDADGNTTTYVYDSEGNRIQQTDALGHVTTYTYEPTFNQMTSMTDPNGRTTTYTIDPTNGNLLRTTDPLGNFETWTYDSHGNVLTHTDKDGNTTTTNTYDGNGNLATTTDALGYVTTTHYDAEGNMLSRTDANGHITQYTYDGLNRLITVTDPLGNVTTNAYDGEGDLTQVTDRDGNVTQYQYDSRDRLIKVTDALGHTTTTAYDYNNNIVSTTDQNGHTTKYTYDVQNRLIKTVDALGDTSTTTYDPVGNKLTQTDANGHTTTNTYDALNRQVTSTDAVGSVTTTIYDVTGPLTGPCAGVCTGPTLGSRLPSEVIDGDGHASLHIGITYYHYDGLDRRLQVVHKQFNTANDEPPDPNDAVTYTTYDAVGNVLSVTEPDGNTTTDVYDANNRRIKQTNAAGDVTTWSYDEVGNVSTWTGPTSNVTTNKYDADNRVIQVTDGGGTVSTYTYDPMGNQLTRTDGNGNTTTNAYDAVYRIIQVTDPLGQSTTYSYDPTGNMLTATDRNGNETKYAYDAINRCTSVTDALSHVTKYQYDAVGNQVKLTDANGHATSYAYDGVNRLITETYADGHARTYTYDYVGNLTSRTDQNGVTTTYNYSDLYFLTSRVYPSSTDTFTYDLSGRMLSGTRGGWVTTYTYDGANRVLTNGQGGETVDYSYNIPAPTTRTITYPGGRSITESLDIRSRLDQIDDPALPPSVATYTYDAADRVVSRNYHNGTSSAYTYNNDDWITNLQHSFGVTPIAGFAYAYDNEGNKLYEGKLTDSTHSEAYQYDNIYRLITYKVGTLVGSTVPLPSTQITYTLDPVGNWPKKVTTVLPGPTTTTENRTHSADNEIATINGSPLSNDNNGNLTADSLYTYAYDEENRLTSVTRKSDSRLVGQYQYDALSRRVQKVANPATPPSPTTTLFFYDDARIIEEQNSAFMTQATYVYGNYIDEVLTMNRLGTNYYYHQNALGSVEAITNSVGAPVEYYRYDAYGLVTVLNGSFNPVTPNPWGTPHSAIGNPYLFTGRELDEETGVYYYRARQYDDAKGRFLQRDIFEDVEADNLYAYVADRPTFEVDPLGAVPCKLFVKGQPRALDVRCSNVHWIVDLEDGKLPAKEDLEAAAENACGEVYKCEDPLGRATCNMTSGAVAKIAVNFLSDKEKEHEDYDKDKNAWVSNRCCCDCAPAAEGAPAAPGAPPGGMPGGDNPGGGGKPPGGGGGGNPPGGGKPPQNPPQGGVKPPKPGPKPIKPKAPTPVVPKPKKK